MTIHVGSFLMVLLLVNQANAQTGQDKKHVGLQVGAPLRIVKKAEEAAPGDGNDQIQTESQTESLLGVPSSLGFVLNEDGDSSIEPDQQIGIETDVAYGVTESLTIGVGYHFVEAEDRMDDHTMTGTVDDDHESHKLLLRANWYFQ